MQLILVRHGEPLAERAVPGAAPGPGADPALSPVGRAQALALAGWFDTAPDRDAVAEIAVSPMTRARETAAPVAAGLGLDPVVDDDLAEFDRGRPDYVPVHERPDDDPDWERIRHGYFPAFVDAESFTARVVAALDAVAARHAGRASALVVCHAGVINTYLTALLGIDRPLLFPLGHASLSRVLVSRSGERRVFSVNEGLHVHRGG